MGDEKIGRIPKPALQSFKAILPARFSIVIPFFPSAVRPAGYPMVQIPQLDKSLPSSAGQKK